MVPVTEIHRTRPFTVYVVTLDDGTELECADRHIVYRLDDLSAAGLPEWHGYSECFANNLVPGDKLVTKKGYSTVVSVEKMPYKMCMYDMSVATPEHRYYTNGVLSHNTTTMASIFAYLLTFMKDRNYMLLANKEATVIEITDKVIQVFKGLPYFLKPGCRSFGKTGFRLDNGCRIITGATTKTTSIGFTVHLLYLDEFAHIDPTIVDSF